MQRLSTRKKKSPYKAKKNIPEFFTILPQEMLEHIYSFLTNKKLIDVSTVNRYLHNSIKTYVLPLRARQYIKEKLVQSSDIDFYLNWQKEINIKKDADLILRIANKIKTNQTYPHYKTTAYKISKKITQLTYNRQFLPHLTIAPMVYILLTIAIPIIHMGRVSRARNASSDDIKNNPVLLHYVDKGHLELGGAYFSFVMIGAILIGLTIFALLINELYKKFSYSHISLQEQIKQLSLEKKSARCSQSTASFFTKKIEVNKRNIHEKQVQPEYGCRINN